MKNGFLSTLKAIYSRQGYFFIAMNILCFIVIFFVLDEKTGGSILMRIFTFLTCIVIGGLLGMFWSRNKKGNRIQAFRNAAGTFLVFYTFIMWSYNGYKPTHDRANGSSATEACTCTWCGGSGETGSGGQSAAQVRRTGNGLGNSCMTCGGDGKA